MTKENIKHTLVGRVTSDMRDKTRTVVIEWARRHPMYGKVMRKTTKYHIHDPENTSHVGDLVEIKEVRPVSKTKTWALVKVLETAPEIV